MNPPRKRRKKTIRLFDPDGSLIDLDSVLALMDAWSDAALLVSEERKVLATNATLRRFIGAHNDTVIGLDAYELLFPEGGAPEDCPLELTVQEDLERHTAMWERKDTGRWLEASITKTLFRTRKKNRVYLFRQRDVSEREEVLRQIKLRTQELEALRDLLLLDPGVPLDVLLQLVLERLVDLSWLGVQRRGIAFTADERGDLTMRAAVGLSTTAVELCTRVPRGTCMCGRASAAKELIYAPEVGREHSRRHEHMQPHGHYCVPFHSEDRLLGVLTFYLPAGHRRSRREEAFLRSAASVVGVMVERAYARLDKTDALARADATTDDVVRTMGLMLEAQSPGTTAHQRRVAELAVALGQELALPPHRLRTLELAAGLHHLDPEILAAGGMDPGVVTPVLQLGESWDGSGEPAGLAGEAIGIEARVLAAADCVEGAATARGGGSLGLAAGGAALLEGRGSRLDPGVADAFMRLMSQDRLPAWLQSGT